MEPRDMNWVYEEIRTFAYLHAAAAWALQQADSAKDRQMFASMHAILASVHCLEAFTNHLGPPIFRRRMGHEKSQSQCAKGETQSAFGSL